MHSARKGHSLSGHLSSLYSEWPESIPEAVTESQSRYMMGSSMVGLPIDSYGP